MLQLKLGDTGCQKKLPKAKCFRTIPGGHPLEESSHVLPFHRLAHLSQQAEQHHTLSTGGRGGSCPGSARHSDYTKSSEDLGRWQRWAFGGHTFCQAGSRIEHLHGAFEVFGKKTTLRAQVAKGFLHGLIPWFPGFPGNMFKIGVEEQNPFWFLQNPLLGIGFSNV